MKYLARIQFLILCTFIAARTCDAAGVKVQTEPLFYVGNMAAVPAQMAWQVNCAYDNAGYKQVLADSSPTDPGYVVARFFDFKMGPKPDFAGYARFYSPTENQTTLKQNFESGKADAQQIKGITIVAEYDFGASSIVTYAASVGGDVGQLLGVYLLKKTATGWEMTTLDYMNTSAGILAELDSGNRLFKFHGQPAANYQYKMALPGGSLLLFNGNRYDLKLGRAAQPADKLSSFVNQAWITGKEGTKADWLKLFTPEEASQREGDMKQDVVPQAAYFTAKNARLAFAIDFGPQAVAFLENTDNPGSDLQPVLLWKGAGDDYKLTDVDANMNKQPPYELSFSANLPKIFDLKSFQDGLKEALR